MCVYMCVSKMSHSVLCGTLQVVAAFLTHYEFRKGVHSGGVLFVLWSILVIFLIAPFRSIILHTRDGNPMVSKIIINEQQCDFVCEYEFMTSVYTHVQYM